jgi:tetratricopeptide (TPR) repeat protein
LPSKEAQQRWFLLALAVVVLALTVRTIRRNDDYVHGVRLWEQVVAYNPQHGRGHRMLARYYFESKRYDDAAAQFQQSVSLHPSVFQTWIEYGNLYFKQENYPEARKRYERATKLNPKSWRAWINLGRCGLVEGDFPAALAATRKAMEAEPDDPTARKQVAWILATAPDEQVRNGREALAILQATKPNAKPVDFQFLEVLAAAHAEAGQFEEAIRVSERGLAAARQYDPRREATFAACIKRYQAHEPERFQPPRPKTLTAVPQAPKQGT